MDRKWWKEAVIYQIYPRSFNDSNRDGIGDLKGIILKLDYLKMLGVDVIWLCPVYKSPNIDNGYDISDYKDIMDDFGTLADLDDLLKEVHNRGMKLIMDLVVNHTSDKHKWFLDSRESKDNPYRDYYIWRSGKDGRPPNNWLSFFSGSVWEYDEKTDEYYLHLFAKEQPDLNWENPKVRQEVYDMMTWWLDRGIDGFRMDVINLISKVEGLPDAGEKEDILQWGGEYFMNGPRIHEFLQEMNQKVLSKYDIMTVGEMPGALVEDAVCYSNKDNTELNMIFQFEHISLGSNIDKWDIEEFNLVEFKRCMSKWQEGLAGKGWNSLYLNNHDQPRMVSRFGNDQDYRVESAKMLATMLHTLQGTPYIYQGEEIGMTNVKFESIEEYNDVETLNMYQERVVEGNYNQEDVMNAIYEKGRDNARTPMQWDDTKNAGFTTGVPWIKVNPNYKEINVKKEMENPESIFYYYRKLIQLRKKYDIIVYGDYQLILAEDESIYAYLRKLDNERLLVILSFSETEVDFMLPVDISFTSKELLISNYNVTKELCREKIQLRPYETRVYLLN